MKAHVASNDHTSTVDPPAAEIGSIGDEHRAVEVDDANRTCGRRAARLSQVGKLYSVAS